MYREMIPKCGPNLHRHRLESGCLEVNLRRWPSFHLLLDKAGLVNFVTDNCGVRLTSGDPVWRWERSYPSTSMFALGCGVGPQMCPFACFH